MNQPAHQASSLQQYLAVLRQRKWILLQALVLVPVLTLVLTLHQQQLYRGYAEVLVNRQNLANTLTGAADPAAQGTDFQAVLQTQAKLAVVPTVARSTLDAVGLPNRSTKQLLQRTDVSADPQSDLLVFQVKDPNKPLAARITTEYARQYTLYKRRLDTASLTQARLEVQARLKALGGTSPAVRSSLSQKEQQLRTLEALQVSNASVVRPSSTAPKIQPKPLRNGVLGLLLGLLLGVGLAFLRNALDTRVRSEEEIGRILHLPMLARLHAPPLRFARRSRVAMIEDPQGPTSEPFRMLRMRLDMVGLDRRPQVVLVTSALEAEGKSTTVANLAVSLARTGRRVALIDLDLRRPSLHKFFDAEQAPGVTSVAMGVSTVEESLHEIDVTLRTKGVEGSGEPYANGRPVQPGGLALLTSGHLPPNPGEFIATQAISHILGELREGFDVVLVDAPPVLPVGDAPEISNHVDGVLLAVRLGFTKRPSLRELHRVLEASPASQLGFVLTGAPFGGRYGYVYGDPYYAEATRAPERV